VTPDQLSTAIVHALTALVGDGLGLPRGVPGRVVVERPKNREHGDYATNVALQLAKQAGVPPRDLAARLAERLVETDGIDSVDVAGPGFLNIRLAAAAQGVVAAQVVAAGAAYGTSDTLAGTRFNVEFISANPTGPIHLGHTRWAVVGDAIARVLEATGAQVTREFYINDRGNQMDHFGASLEATALGRPVPQDGYHGDYIHDLARRVVEENPHILDLPEGERLVAFREAGYKIQLGVQQDQLASFRTVFDVWYSERSLHEADRVTHGLEKLRAQGHLFEADGALWMRTTDFGDDKDRVLIRSDGELTYFASDTAYYVDKRERGFDVCLYLLGADHHGYVNRLRAMAACAGDDPDVNVEVLIGQLVKIMRGGEEIRLSKRAGTIVTLEELVEMIGVDALRYTLSRYPADSPLTLDVEQITRQASDNPVFYVQYAHARLSSILRNAADLGLAPAGVSSGSTSPEFDPSVLSHEKEGELLRALAEFPRVVASAAQLREPHRVARYLEETAGTFHRFYDACRVLPMGDEEPTSVHAARLLLVAATRTVLANGLGLLGVSAPERM
jgi:arginyl-tRNA synthetase